MAYNCRDGWPTIAEMSGLDTPKYTKFFNTSGNLYKELQLKDRLLSMNDEEQLKLLATNGMLVKRPIIIKDDTILIGFKEEEWMEQLL